MRYTELLQHLRDLAESNPMVNTVTRGEVGKLDLDKANIYPLVHIDIDTGNYTGSTMEFNVYVACLQQRDVSDEVVTDKFWRQDNEVDNHNETLQILTKLWAEVYRDWQGKYINSDNASFSKITYAKGNLLDGWELTFTAGIPFDIDLC